VSKNYGLQKCLENILFGNFDTKDPKMDSFAVTQQHALNLLKQRPSGTLLSCFAGHLIYECGPKISEIGDQKPDVSAFSASELVAAHENWRLEGHAKVVAPCVIIYKMYV
jgi:hypothetical protein